MRSYTIKLPRGIEVNIFNLPEDFEQQVTESFRGYTEGTAKEYRYCDKLGYIDCCVRHLNGDKQSDDVVNENVERCILHQWREYGEIIDENDVYCFEFMEDCYEAGKKTLGCIRILETMTIIFMIRFRKCLLKSSRL